MSVFTNPASRSIEQAKAYTAAVLDLLGARNPMEVLQETPLALRKALAGLSEGQMAEPEARGKWSVRHVVQHLAMTRQTWRTPLMTLRFFIVRGNPHGAD